MRNIEAKFRVPDLAAVRARALALGARPVGRLEQVDTYFFAPNGRLKLREVAEVGQPAAAWLIAYQRADDAGARLSAYEIAPVPDAAALLAVLRPAMGVRVRVAKTRDLLLLRHTRLHLDDVRGLGSFVELETLVGPPDARRGAATEGMEGAADEAAGGRELAEIVAGLGLLLEDGIPGSYADLLEAAPGLAGAGDTAAP
jgi:adenylate cyclase class IV